MGKKAMTGSGGPQIPVDQYRKQLGKHTNFEHKKREKVVKRKEGQQVERSKTFGLAIHVLLCMLLVVMGVYTILYLGLQENKYVLRAVYWSIYWVDEYLLPILTKYAPFSV